MRRAESRGVLAWALWDWGSAAFNAVVTTFVFTVYLTSSAFGDGNTTSSALGAGMAVAGVAIALVAPVVGQSADRSGRTTWWLGVNTAVVVVLMAALYFVRPDPAYLWLGVALVAVGNVVFEFAAVNYNALLPTVARPENIGRVSALGWGAGYLGGIVLLLILVVGFINPEVGWFGVTSADGSNVRVGMVLSAAWFALAAIPILVRLRARRPGSPAGREGLDGHDGQVGHDTPSADRAEPVKLGVIGSYRALWHTVRGLARSSPRTLGFLIASAVFRDGLAGVFTFGGIIAAVTFGFTPGQVITFGIAANVVAGIITIVSGAADDRVGPKAVIVGSLLIMIVAGLGLFALRDAGPNAFWVLGLALAAFVGPAQSASRTFLARVIPPGREGEIFGLYATTGRAVSFLAPMAFSASISLGASITGGQAQHFGILGLAFAASRSSIGRPAATSASSAPSAASLTCPIAASSSTRIATRRSTSRCRASPSASRPPTASIW